MVKKNEIKRNYYLNLFSDNAEITDNINDVGTENPIITSTGNFVGGSGYTIAPKVSTTGNCPNFAATSALTPTTVSSTVYTINNGGSGYITGDTLVINYSGTGGGSGVIATVIASGGVITGLNFTNQGSGFTIQAPIVTSVSSTAGTNANITLTLTPTSVASFNITNYGSGFASNPLNYIVFTPENGLGSGASATITGTRATKNKIFKWNIRDLQLGRLAEIALIQLVHTNAANNTGYAIRCLETYADGFDSYNNTSAILYLGMGLNAPSIATYHKLLSQNLNTITLFCTDDLTSSSKVYDGFNKNIKFSVILEVIDYIDEHNTY